MKIISFLFALTGVSLSSVSVSADRGLSENRRHQNRAATHAPMAINGIIYTVEFMQNLLATVSINEAIESLPIIIAPDLTNTFGGTWQGLPLTRIFPIDEVWDGPVPQETHLSLSDGMNQLHHLAAVVVLAIAFLRLYPSDRINEAMQMGAVAHAILLGHVPYIEDIRMDAMTGRLMLSRMFDWKANGDNEAWAEWNAGMAVAGVSTLQILAIRRYFLSFMTLGLLGGSEVPFPEFSHVVRNPWSGGFVRMTDLPPDLDDSSASESEEVDDESNENVESGNMA